MAHYYDDIEPDTIPGEYHKLEKELLDLPAYRFTVRELKTLLRINWYRFHDPNKADLDRLQQIKKASEKRK